MTKLEQKILMEVSRPNRKYNIRSAEFESITVEELEEEIEKDQEDETESVPNVYYVPLIWATDLVNQAYAAGRIKDAPALKTLIDASIQFLTVFPITTSLSTTSITPLKQPCCIGPIHDHLINAIGSQKLSCLCLLDLSAAFDTIDHNILIIRLSSWFSPGHT